VTVSIERIRETLDYDPDSGVLVWKIDIGRGRRGCVAGPSPRKGYLWIAVDGERIASHVVAWAHFYGSFPSFDVDHKDLDKSNNRINNLRESTRSQNMANVPPPKNNKSGFKGVCWDKQHGKWRSKICVNYKYITLGVFASKEEAARAYDDAAVKHFGEFARLNLP
jgi:hypothetical protein